MVYVFIEHKYINSLGSIRLLSNDCTVSSKTMSDDSVSNQSSRVSHSVGNRVGNGNRTGNSVGNGVGNTDNIGVRSGTVVGDLGDVVEADSMGNWVSDGMGDGVCHCVHHRGSNCHSVTNSVTDHTRAKSVAKELRGRGGGGGEGSDAKEGLHGEQW